MQCAGAISVKLLWPRAQLLERLVQELTSRSAVRAVADESGVSFSSVTLLKATDASWLPTSLHEGRFEVGQQAEAAMVKYTATVPVCSNAAMPALLFGPIAFFAAILGAAPLLVLPLTLAILALILWNAKYQADQWLHEVAYAAIRSAPAAGDGAL